MAIFNRFSKRMLNEETFNSLALSKSMLNEMAMSLEDFKDKVLHLQFQLVENWCLCKWCQLFDIDNDNFYHWLIEFRAYAMALQHAKLKSGSKEKILTREFIENYDYNDSNSIISIIKEKFDNEDINDASQKQAVAKEFSTKVEKLIAAICSSIPIGTYIREEFGLDNEQKA